MNLDGCSFRVGDRPKSKKGRLSLRSQFSKSFTTTVSTDLPSKSTTIQEEKKQLAESIDFRQGLYLKNWQRISDEISKCAERVFDGVLKELITFVDVAASVSENSAFGNLSAATVQFGASDDDKFFGDVESRLRARYPVVRLRAETCKTAHKCIQQIISGFFAKMSDENTDLPDMHISTMRRFAEWLKNNPSSDFPSPTKRHKKEKRETPKALVIVFENLEAFDRQVVDDVVLVLGGYTHALRFVLIFGVATEARVVHSLLSHDSYKLLALRTFRFPPPTVFLNQLIDNTVFNDEIWFKFHPKMVQLFVGRFEQENFSIAELTKSMKLALLDYFLKEPASTLCSEEPIAQQRLNNNYIISSIRALESVKKANIVSAAPASQIAKQLYEPLSELFVYVRCYKPVLRVLISLLQDLPDACFAQINQNIVHLHHAVMSSGDFFNAKLDHFYGKATALWACWTVDEWKEQLSKCVQILNSADQEAQPDLNDIVQELERFIANLNNIDERQQRADAQMIEEQHENYVGKSPTAAEAKKRMADKLSFFEMQRKIQLRRVVAAKSNIFQRDKKEIGEYLTKMFKRHLRSPDSIPMHECLFTTLTDSFRSRSMAAPNKCLDQTLLCPEMIFGYRHEPNSQQDIAVAFQCFQKLAAESKSVSMATWLAAFVKSAELRALDEEDQLTRFYKCVGELELIGCLKAASERNLMSAHKLYWTSEVISGFGAAPNN